MMNFILANTPTEFGDFFEPFLGGGAVALELLQKYEDKEFYLSDYNIELIISWEQVRSNPEAVIETLNEYDARHTPEFFKSVRSWDKDGLLEIKPEYERAARFIYICQGSFGGGYRTNQNGHCSSTYAEKKINTTTKAIREVSTLLNDRNIQFYHRSFDTILNQVKGGDFIYLDPPYAIDADDENYNPSDDYVKSSDTDALTAQVKRLMNKMTARGAYCLVSNASTPSTRELWDGWNTVHNTVVWTGGAGRRPNEERLWANHHLVRKISNTDN